MQYEKVDTHRSSCDVGEMPKKKSLIKALTTIF